MSEYARVYHSVIDDPKFDGIREDMRLFGSWTMLLVVADMAWPAPAFVPPTVPKSAYARLVACGLVDELPGGRYRIHGLQTERASRTEAARAAGLASARSRGVEQSSNGRSTAAQLPEQSKAIAEQSKREDDRADIEAFLAVRYRLPTPAQRTLMDAYCRVYDQTGPDRAARLIFSHPDDPIGALKADLEQFRAERKAEAADSEEPKPAPRRKPSGLTGVNAELAKMFQAKYAEEGEA